MKINITADVEFRYLVQYFLAHAREFADENIEVNINLIDSSDGPTYKDISETLQVALDQSNRTLETLIHWLKANSNHS